MSRYEATKSKKYLPAFLMIALIFLMVAIVLLYKNNEQVADNKIEPLVIPLEEKAAKERKLIALNQENNELLPKIEQDLNHLMFAQNEITPLDLDLENSDEIFKVAVTELSKNLMDGINVKGIINKYIIIVNDLSQKQILYKNRKFLKMPQAMQVKEDASGLYISEKSYQRYNLLANAIAAVNVQKALGLYLKFKPLFQQVYNEFSYPESYHLEDIFIKASAAIIQAPVLEKRIKLVRHSVGYKFADKKLEAMNAVEKQMLRMGPKNTQKIQEKLKQFVKQLLLLNE